MKNQNGFSLIELLISIIVASIIILTAGGLSGISLNSFNKILSRQETCNDLSYGLKLIRNRFRNAKAEDVRKNVSAPSAWVDTTRLEIGNAAFGIYKPDNSLQREFVYLPDKTNPNKREVLLAVPDGNLAWTVTCNPSCPSPQTLSVVLSGTKKKNPFYMETTIARRNP